MIIESATKHIEVDGNDRYGNWHYLSLSVNDTIYRIVFEQNAPSGLYYIRQWSIDGNYVSDIPCKYSDNANVQFDCGEELLSTKEFESSITYDLLLKPMGLPRNLVEDRDFNWSMYPSDLLMLLDYVGIQYKVLYNTIRW